MEWALGISLPTRQSQATTATNSRCGLVRPDDLAHDGIPEHGKDTRLTYVGDFSSWCTVDPAQYLAAFRIRLPKGAINRHQVFSVQTDRLTIHVPALVLMRAFFRPTKYMLPAAFTPVGPDMLSFVDYTQDPPNVVADYRAYLPASPFKVGPTQDKALEWLQLSRSARASVISAYHHGLEEWLNLSLPSGRARIGFQGVKKNGILCVTKATLLSVYIAEEDSLIGQDQEFFFNAVADTDRTPAASSQGILVPRHADGSVETTAKEWEVIESILVRDRSIWAHPPQLVLDIMLRKLDSGASWESVADGRVPMNNLAVSFHKWKTTGKLDQVLTMLEAERTRAEL